MMIWALGRRNKEVIVSDGIEGTVITVSLW